MHAYGQKLKKSRVPVFQNLLLSVVPRAATPAAPGSSLEMQNLRLHPRPPEPEPAFVTRSLGEGCAH